MKNRNGFAMIELVIVIVFVLTMTVIFSECGVYMTSRYAVCHF